MSPESSMFASNIPIDPENAWETPEPLQHRWDTVYKEVTLEQQAFPLEPALRKNVGS
ncbi:uncharacterized protein N7477_002348 [Penicillium maclennaniae]|uniref:uncharacterized protein n=1 Tax=Penicillium maclennaniae TaxID=1343394 RepID=UPI002541792A|nr:uncharacterized protein N7477_002348 [Penicillium maclennaniae]KAJ5676715.1 hypothetical protein N7477_002348 [Penicillium maclennaniae]